MFSVVSQQNTSLESQESNLNATIKELQGEFEASKAAHTVAMNEFATQVESDKAAMSDLQARYKEANKCNATLAEELHNLKSCNNSALMELQGELRTVKSLADELHGKLEMAFRSSQIINRKSIILLVCCLYKLQVKT